MASRRKGGGETKVEVTQDSVHNQLLLNKTAPKPILTNRDCLAITGGGGVGEGVVGGGERRDQSGGGVGGQSGRGSRNGYTHDSVQNPQLLEKTVS